MTAADDYAIIVAGGKGLRMGTDIPKQFLPIGGLPVLMRTIMRFNDCGGMRVIVVLPREQQDYWRQLCGKYSFNIDIAIADGGSTRFHSVSNGLSLIPPEAQGVVGVHDGVRPFVSNDVIRRCYEAARTCGAAIPVTSVVETLRHVQAGGSVTVPRGEYVSVQTPQAFGIPLLRKAYRQPYSDTFTDDASVVESLGAAITLVDGSRANIKITTPADLAIADYLVRQEGRQATGGK